MKSIRQRKWNGYNVVSTFAGCGGSSLGYRMAGFRILWASEFVEAARDVYSANARKDTILDGRDIREVTADEILSATKLERGELDLLDGSPPCAAFSTAGRRETTWGKVKMYSDTKQRSDDLFFEYVRLLDGIKPKVFVGENVSGLTRGRAKGYFLEIMDAMKACGYKVQARLLDAQWLGVPQARKRVIFIGVRDDLEADPVYPTPLPYRYSVTDAVPAIRAVKTNKSVAEGPSPTILSHGRRNTQSERTAIAAVDIGEYAIGKEWDKIKPGGKSDKYLNLVKASPDAPCQTITAAGGEPSIASVVHPYERRKFTIAELKRICAFPDDFKVTGTYAQQWERLGRAVPPLMMRAIAETIRDEVLPLCQTNSKSRQTGRSKA